MLCFDLIRLRFLWVRSEDTYEILELPLLDIIIVGVHAMDVSLDGIAFIANDESGFFSIYLQTFVDSNLHDWLQVIPDHSAELLGCQFEGAIANEQYGPSITRFLCG